MIIIHKDQMELFRKASLENFENEMVRHIEKFTPPHYKVIGEAGARDVIRLGIKKAEEYGLTNRGPVRFYIEMMFMFGSALDTDPQLPWVQHILTDDQIFDQMDRSEHLYKKTTDYLGKVGGPQNIYTKNALQGIRRRAAEPFSFSAESFENEMLREMQQVYPEKCAYVGDAALRNLIMEGLELAEIYSVGTLHGIMVFVVLMFAMGHGFADDPLFPWIARTLHNPKVADPDKRVQRLESKSITYLDNVLSYFAQE